MKNKMKEINLVANGIRDVINKSNLSPIEILGILEIIRQSIQKDCICDECKKKGVEL